MTEGHERYPRWEPEGERLSPILASPFTESLHLSILFGNEEETPVTETPKRPINTALVEDDSPESVLRRREDDGATWVPPRWKLTEENYKAEAESRIEAARTEKIIDQILYGRHRSSSSEPQSSGTSDISDPRSSKSSPGLVPVRALLSRLLGRWNSSSSEGEKGSGSEQSASSSGTTSSVSVLRPDRSKSSVNTVQKIAPPAGEKKVEAALPVRSDVNHDMVVEEEAKIEIDVPKRASRVKKKLRKLFDAMKRQS